MRVRGLMRVPGIWDGGKFRGSERMRLFWLGVMNEIWLIALT